MRGVGGGGVTRRSHIVGESSSCEAQWKVKRVSDRGVSGGEGVAGLP